MPACYTGVLGVATDPELQGPDFHVTDTADLWGVQIFASSRHDVSEYPHGCKETFISNSYAAPLITAKVHEIVSAKNGSYISALSIYQELAGRPVSIERMYPDFLTEAIIFDPGNQLKQEDCIAFPILGRYSNTAAFLNAIEQNRQSPIVLMPSSNLTPDFIDAVCRCSTKRLGVIYAGTAPVDLRVKLPCVLWDESMCRPFVRKGKVHAADTNIAMIRAEPQGEGSLRLLSRLKVHLTEKGYGCIAISDFPKSYLYGLEYLPKNCAVNSLLSYLCYAQRPDIVLCSSYENARLPHEDMLVQCSDDAVESYSENFVVLPSVPAEKDIQKLLSTLDV